MRELLAHHSNLLLAGPVVTERVFRVGGERGQQRGNLTQTTIRFRADLPPDQIRTSLTRVFLGLLRGHEELETDGFEVVLTFNAAVTNSERTSFSVFYGHDHSAQNYSGAAPELRYGEPYLVRSLADVDRLPVTFDFETLAANHRNSFENSDVQIERFLNIIFLVYRYVHHQPAQRASRRRL
jgi:hypothetical protein